MLNGLDLFSGIGGLALALQPWARPVAYCENDRYAQSVLLSRMSEHRLPCAPIWTDIQTLRASEFGTIDIVWGGFPCQDISVAGTGVGLAGERSGLFTEIVRLTQEISPSFVFLENVPAIRTRGLDQVLRAFTDLRYDCRWTCVSAAEVGAHHLRKRWFMLAYTHRENVRDEQRRGSGKSRPGAHELGHDGKKKSLADAQGVGGKSRRLGSGKKPEITESFQHREHPSANAPWPPEPDVGRVAYGVRNRVDRNKCLGNAVVPGQAREAFKRLMGIS